MFGDDPRWGGRDRDQDSFDMNEWRKRDDRARNQAHQRREPVTSPSADDGHDRTTDEACSTLPLFGCDVRPT
jgi:hypothetical protein